MKVIVILSFWLISLFAGDLTLEIVKEVESKPTIAIEDATGRINESLGKKFFKLLIGDLEVSAHFDVNDTHLRSEFDEGFDVLKHKKNDFVLRYKLSMEGRNQLSAQAKLYDLKQDTTLFSKTYSLTPDRYPFLAHKIVYDLNRALGFKDVEFLKNFVVYSKYTKPKHADIYISDYTLTYQKKVISGGLNLFPKWANSRQTKFYYTALEDKPTLYLVDIYTGDKRKVLESEGMLVCSDVSKDGTKLLLTMAPKFQPDIYQYDVITKQLTQITNYVGIDVNGNFTKNERRVVFVSDRLGYPTIFTKRIGSRAVERVVYHGRNSNACNAFEDYIIYSSRETDNEFGKNTFNLYLASLNSDYIRRLTANGVNIFPRFAKDGETVLFIKELGNQVGLGLIRLKYNKTYIYPLHTGRIQSIDW
ncbi:MAG: Tol-Pal system protein TolB [Epsilonproteobacteria bacterium]|nr:Tol-Pal system protein TolB [Campylobacterota bacterium]